MRIDKWLWVARFFKTRSLALDHIEKGRVLINGERPKPSRILKEHDMVQIKKEDALFVVEVLGFCLTRRPAKEAQLLYKETEESIAERMNVREQRRLSPTPKPQMKPDKKSRRLLRDLKNQ